MSKMIFKVSSLEKIKVKRFLFKIQSPLVFKNKIDKQLIILMNIIILYKII